MTQTCNAEMLMMDARDDERKKNVTCSEGELDKTESVKHQRREGEANIPVDPNSQKQRDEGI